MKAIAAVLALLWPVLAFGSAYSKVEVDRGGKRLIIFTADGRKLIPRLLPRQVAFDSPVVSGDGKRVGWLALYPNCCTSYPIPLKIVVLERGKRLRTLTGNGQPIFGWCFLGKRAEVAFRQGVLHGSNYQHFERRSLADGKLLSEYDYPHEEQENQRARRLAPSWVQCVPA